MIPTRLTVVPLDVVQWGRVIVGTHEGKFIRDYEISAEEAENVHKFNKPPPGLRDDEVNMCWGVESRPLRPFQCGLTATGELVVNYGNDPQSTRISSRVAVLQPDEFEIKQGVVYVCKRLANKMEITQ